MQCYTCRLEDRPCLPREGEWMRKAICIFQCSFSSSCFCVHAPIFLFLRTEFPRCSRRISTLLEHRFRKKMDEITDEKGSPTDFPCQRCAGLKLTCSYATPGTVTHKTRHCHSCLEETAETFCSTCTRGVCLNCALGCKVLDASVFVCCHCLDVPQECRCPEAQELILDLLLNTRIAKTLAPDEEVSKKTIVDQRTCPDMCTPGFRSVGEEGNRLYFLYRSSIPRLWTFEEHTTLVRVLKHLRKKWQPDLQTALGSIRSLLIPPWVVLQYLSDLRRSRFEMAKTYAENSAQNFARHFLQRVRDIGETTVADVIAALPARFTTIRGASSEYTAGILAKSISEVLVLEFEMRVVGYALVCARGSPSQCDSCDFVGDQPALRQHLGTQLIAEDAAHLASWHIFQDLWIRKCKNKRAYQKEKRTETKRTRARVLYKRQALASVERLNEGPVKRCRHGKSFRFRDPTLCGCSEGDSSESEIGW
eukprot:GEMP01040529.1.p1 GENE.GEMP01040529.1~~GEMP01040529.1.p1  ORF type:complete len:478 (+),score=78.70 GEMP01040529.1:13-1446(+)